MKGRGKTDCGPIMALGVWLGVASLGWASDVMRGEQGFTIQNERLSVALDPATGVIQVTDRGNGHVWRQPPSECKPFRDVEPIADGVRFVTDLWNKGRSEAFTVRLTVPADRAELVIEADRADRTLPMDVVWFLPPLVLETDAGALAVADYSNGHLYPLDAEPFPARWFQVSRLDMPWVGVCDVARGFGYALVLETPDDAVIEVKPYELDGRQRKGPRVGWMSSHRTFRYPRRLAYHFRCEGGYVALAKAYRAYAAEQGLIVSLEEKARENANVKRLYGAIDVWGGTPEFVREARSAGIERMILHGRFEPELMREANEAGYLTAVYDIYADILPMTANRPLDSHHDQVPEHVVLQADGERMKAWLTYDKKTQYMKRCPAVSVAAAQVIIPPDLAQRPYLGRFIDVATAEDLYECYDPAHPMTRQQKREASNALLGYVRSLDQVVGGEHGRWWAVPKLDYIEGMMSANSHFAWPAGHLIRPTSKEETFEGRFDRSDWERYDQYGIGNRFRVPLWELVFHDCVVSTWYWGDSSDFLNGVDRSNQDRKDAFNVLYGTIPLLWVSRGGGWETDRERFLETYRHVSPVHRAVAGQEMIEHAFLSEDRDLQRSRFANGVEVVVSFDERPRVVEVGGESVELAPFGFVASGAGLDARLVMADGAARFLVREEAQGR